MQNVTKCHFVLIKAGMRAIGPYCCSLLDPESTGFGPKRLRCSVRPLFPIEHG